MSDLNQSNSENRFINEWREAEKRGYCHLALVTANRLRMGKSYAAIRIGELLDPNFTIDNVGFETRWYIREAQDAPPGKILVLDEPNRAAGNRSWYTEENRMFAEFLQTNAFRQIHGLFPLPHEHLMDNAVTAVCTFQIVMYQQGVGVCYVFRRDQLNRNFKTKTLTWGPPLHFKMPDAKLVHAYEKKRREYTLNRNKLILERMDAATEAERQPTAKDYVNTIIENHWSTASQIQEGLGVGHSRAYDLLKRAKHEAILRKVVFLSPNPTS